jgi:hypothetical protein
MFDVADYWNLRAAGFSVFPLPVGHYRDFSEGAKPFAERASYNITSAMRLIEVVKGRSVEESQLTEAGEWLHSLGLGAGRLSLQGWVPRFGERHYRIAPEVKGRPVVSKQSDEIVIVGDGHGTLQGPAPDCELNGESALQHWATELQVFSSGDDVTFRLPWLHPECDKVANYRIGHHFGPESSRVSKQGIVVIREGDRQNVWIDEPKVTEVFRAYLRDAGFTYVKTSSPGLALERIIEQMGGLFACAVFQNPGVRKIIENLANGSSMHAEEVRVTIHKTLQGGKAERQQQIENILNTLVSKKVLRQGTILQCQRCQRHDWYHLSELDEEFKCKKCFHVQLVPMLDKNPWHYVSDGLFRLEGKVAGCLTAILSLVFLNLFVDHGLKYVASFDYTNGPDAAERDFAVLSSGILQDDVDVIVGECKTSKEIEENQKKDIELLGEKTGAFLAFSTLCEDFTANDKAFFEELVIAGRRPILLTRRHLEMNYLAVGDYRHSGGGVGRDADVLSRQTVADALGRPFAEKYDRSP